MVRITIIAGRYKGAVREFDGMTARGTVTVVDPKELLTGLFMGGSDWKMDLSQAEDREIFQWMLADMVARIIRAYQDGRPITVGGVVFTREDDIGVIEDTIAHSGQHVRVASDDADGLVIELHQLGPEPPSN